VISRRGLVQELEERLGRSDRLVTLTGPGGIGKTWLARAAAADLGRNFEAGAHVVDVREAPDGALLTQIVARGLAVPMASVDVDALVHAIAARHILLVLDGCDELLLPCADLVVALLRSCPRLVVLATSRQPMRVAGEQVMAVPPLSLPATTQSANRLSDGSSEAVALFLERAEASLPGFGLTAENSEAVTAVCAALEGNPLAIGLAAGRVRVLGPHAILDRLVEPYRLLTGGATDSSRGDGSLRASVDLSYHLCSDEERTLWARLSVFPASFDLDAVEAVCSGDGIADHDLLDLVDSLLEKSVLAREQPDATHVRYRLLETLRAYGAEKLGAEAAGYWRRRHLEWCDALARTRLEGWFGLRQLAGFTLFERERANLSAALELSTSDSTTAPQALRIAAGLEWFWLVSGRLHEGRRWLRRALRHETGTPAERGRALGTAAWFATLQGDPLSAEQLLAEARAVLEGAEDVGRAAVRRAEGAVAARGGRHDEADSHFQLALRDAALTGCAATEAEGWLVLGLHHGLAGRADAADEAVRRSLALAERADDPLLCAYALGWLGLAAMLGRDHVTAAARAREALRHHAEVDDPFGSALLYEVLAWAAVAAADGVRAATLAGAADQSWKALGVTVNAVPPLAEGRDDRLAAVREALGVRDFLKHRERGAAMPREAAIRYAVDNVVPWQRRSDSSGPLTDREFEVATLVARGMANREIAAALSISVRTAQGHVESILRKLQFGSRSQIAAWVTERTAQQRAYGGPDPRTS
jgi:non-specific serine/threonine protein kinase